MEDINLQTFRGTLWFQHDGALAHCAGIVRDYSNERFSQRWIGRKTNIFSLIAQISSKIMDFHEKRVRQF